MDWDHFHSCPLLSLTLPLSPLFSVFLHYKLFTASSRLSTSCPKFIFLEFIHGELMRPMSDLVRPHYSSTFLDHSLVYWTTLVPALIFKVPVLVNSPPSENDWFVPNCCFLSSKPLLMCHLNFSSELLLKDLIQSVLLGLVFVLHECCIIPTETLFSHCVL